MKYNLTLLKFLIDRKKKMVTLCMQCTIVQLSYTNKLNTSIVHLNDVLTTTQ